MQKYFADFIVGGCLNIPNTVFAGDLPPPPRDINEINQLFKLYLDLVVNQYSVQQVVPVIVKMMSTSYKKEAD